MKKIQMLGMAGVVVVAASACVAPVASATLWLKEMKSLVMAEAATTDAEFILGHKGGLIGNVKVKCDGTLKVEVGPGAEDKVLLLENLAKTEQDSIGCNLTENSFGTCEVGTKVTVSSTKLPWLASLELVSNVTWLHFPTVTAYSVACGGLSFECRGLVRARFSENKVNGSLFLLLGNEEVTCSDGGKGTISGHLETLGFSVS